ncbi:cysteine proteinase, partial [Metschnikowia bicuspidata]
DAPQSLGLLMMTYLFDPTFKFDEDILAVKPRGLTNSGNICYMNVVLQCLIFCEPFARLFHLVESKSIASIGTDSPTSLIDATVNFLKDYMTILPSYKLGGSFNSDGIVVGKPLSPEPFYQKLIENPKFRHLSWGLQEDAEEFLGYLLDGLHEEFVKVEVTVPQEQMERLAEKFSQKAPAGRSAALKTSVLQAARLVRTKTTEHVEESEVVNESDSNDWSEIGSGRHVCKRRVVVEPSPITRLFGGRFRSVLTVPKSKEQQSITLDPFRCILLDISLSNIETIEDALWKFNETEMLLYKVEAGNEVVAKKQTFIDELPEILILHLKRFSYQNERPFGSIEKVTKNVLYGLKLAVPPESLSTTLRREHRNNYQLTAVIYHHGRNAEGGHYTCDVFRPGRKWLRIDDTAVEAVDAECVLDMSERDKSAYILMYQR